MKKSEKHIFINGKIFTSDDSHPYADSMIVEEGRIIWIGTKSDMPKGVCRNNCWTAVVQETAVLL